MNNETGMLIAELATTIEFGAYSINAAQIFHAHLTLNEMVKDVVRYIGRMAIRGQQWTLQGKVAKGRA